MQNLKTTIIIYEIYHYEFRYGKSFLRFLGEASQFENNFRCVLDRKSWTKTSNNQLKAWLIRILKILSFREKFLLKVYNHMSKISNFRKNLWNFHKKWISGKIFYSRIVLKNGILKWTRNISKLGHHTCNFMFLTCILN